ncbi:hypothetical protein E1B28_001561 [Marasmius oreades]|uniref:F-box domain-containing protein n=1 Tax=Marasmius oreades TaxID=181124 RepID=A0A9P8AFP1_9AGAR|nr:uncharacterized protein E1B28_001561 [Marasmius oreades]KAG7099748.1 hypothetical protein E1B28_001561 [Marasmius oreades]
MSSHSLLPPELWLEVFYWATLHPTRNAFSTTYRPFSNSQSIEEELILRMKRSLVLVCRDWHLLTKEFLYRDVRIGPAQKALKKALCIPEDGHDCDGYSKFVRRVVLPYQSTTTPTHCSNPLTSVEILKHCSQVEVLVRPRLFTSPGWQAPVDIPRFEFEADSLPLPSLKRLEWNYNVEAERTGGINSLTIVLRDSPNIEYLHLGGFGPRTQFSASHAIHLPKLNTVSVATLTAHIAYQLTYRWSLPSLSHLIIGALNLPSLSTVWEKYGEQLETVEFGKHLSFLQRDLVGPCVQSCPNLRELNYYIFFTLPPFFSEENSVVETIGLHAYPNEMLSDTTATWGLLDGHFDTLFRGAFPMLRNIHLYGDWSPFLTDSGLASRLYEGEFTVYTYP